MDPLPRLKVPFFSYTPPPMLFFAPFSTRDLLLTILIINLILTIIPERHYLFPTFSIIWAYKNTCVSPFENGRNRKMEIFFLAMEICRPTTITLVKSGPKRLPRGTFWKKKPKWCLSQQRNHLLYRKRHQYCTSSYMYLTSAEEFFVLGENAWDAEVHFHSQKKQPIPLYIIISVTFLSIFNRVGWWWWGVKMQLSEVILSSLGWISPESTVLIFFFFSHLARPSLRT